MSLDPPADGQIIAAIIEIIDRDPLHHPSFSAPAVSVSHLAAILNVSPNSIVPAHAADLIRPLSETLFETPREPVIRSLRKGLSKSYWIVFEGICRPGKDQRDFSQHTTPQQATPLPQPPARTRTRTERPSEVDGDIKTLLLIPTLPGGSSYTSPSPTVRKEKGRGGTFFRSFGKSFSKETSSSPDLPLQLSSKESGALTEAEADIRKMAWGENGMVAFDPMRDVAPPTPVSYGSVPFPSPKPNPLLRESMPGRPGEGGDSQAPNRDVVENKDSTSFDIIDACGEIGSEDKRAHYRTSSLNSGIVPARKSLRVDVSRHTRYSLLTPVQEDTGKEKIVSDQDSESSDAFEHDQNSDDMEKDDSDQDQASRETNGDHVGKPGRKHDEDDNSIQKKSQGTSDGDESFKQASISASGQGDQSDNEGDTQGQSLDSDFNPVEGGDKGIDRHETPKHKDKKHHRRSSKHKERSTTDKTTRKKHKHRHRSSQKDPETPWLVQTFEGLPFGPDIPTSTLISWVQSRWRLVAAEVVVLFGVVYILQATGM
ncbi:hypothetical protein IAR50_003136 [Cryptococcus sp. DSM 104548]